MLGRIAIFLFLVNLILLVAAAADCLGGEKQPRSLPRPLWVLVIIFVPIVGSIAWFTKGRPAGDRRPVRRPRQRPAGPALAPDDDPQFLADLDRRLRGEDDSKS
jgi:hypothetical protein